jgi:hypothetical protein
MEKRAPFQSIFDAQAEEFASPYPRSIDYLSKNWFYIGKEVFALKRHILELWRDSLSHLVSDPIEIGQFYIEEPRDN